MVNTRRTSRPNVDDINYKALEARSRRAKKAETRRSQATTHLPTPSPEPEPPVVTSRSPNPSFASDATSRENIEPPRQDVSRSSNNTASLFLPVQIDDADRDPNDDLKKEIARIQPLRNSHSILGLPKGAKEEDIEQAWIRLGCLLHQTRNTDPAQEKGRETAFQKVKGAADALEVDETIIGKIVEWDGKGDIYNDADSDDESMNDAPPAEDEINPPPPQIIQIYESATPALLDYQTDSHNDTTQIRDINQKIIDHNQTFNKSARDDQRVQENSWVIPDNLITLYEQFRDHQLEFWSSEDKVLGEKKEDRERKLKECKDKAKKSIRVTAGLIRGVIKKYHLLKDWNVYPQPMWVHHGDRYLSVTKHRFKWEVCIERFEGGKMIRKLQKTHEEEWYKDLTNRAQLRKWSERDRYRYKGLEFVAIGQIHRKNSAAQNRPAPAKYGVWIETEDGVELMLLTFTNFSKLVKEEDTSGVKETPEDKVKKFCKKEKIPSPWDIPPVKVYHNPGKVARDKAKRDVKKNHRAPAHSTEITNVPITQLQKENAELKSKIDNLENLLRQVHNDGQTANSAQTDT